MNKYILLPLLLLACSTAKSQIIVTVAGNGGAGYSGDGGSPLTAQIAGPYRAVTDNSCNLFITEEVNGTVRKVSNMGGTISTYAGTGTAAWGTTVGVPATSASLFQNYSILEEAGDIYIGQFGMSIRKVDVSGIVSTFASPVGPSGIATNHLGDYFFSNLNVVSKKNASGITTLAGTPTMGGYGGDGGPATAAMLAAPCGVAVDNMGNVFVADYGNHRVRKIDAAGIITTYAGNGAPGWSGDGGPATAAQVGTPRDVAIDNAGNLYIAQLTNNVVRKVTPSGIISTVAGNGALGFGGDGGPATAARLNWPAGVWADASNNLYIADRGNRRVRKVIYPTTTPTFVHCSYFTGTCSPGTPLSVASALAATDADMGQGETWSVLTAPVHGTLAGFPAAGLSNGGMITPVGTTYTTASGYLGLDSFTVLITDAASLSSTIKVYVLSSTAPSAGIISGPSSVCLGSSITLTTTGSGGVWTASNSSATVSGGVVTSVSLGADTISYYVAHPVCPATASMVVTVQPLPVAATISAPDSLCAGASAVLSVSPAVSGTWSVANPSASVAGSTVTGVSAGTNIITYVSTTGFCNDTLTAPLTIVTGPVVSSITGSDSVCIGDTISLTATWTGAGSGTWSATNTNATVAAGIVTGIMTGIDTIQFTASGAYCADSASKIVTVVAIPSAGTITGADSVCVGTAITLSGSVPGGTWSVTNSSATISAAGVVTGMTPGTDTVVYTVTGPAGCTNDTSYIVKIKKCKTLVDDQLADHDELLAFPNPAPGEFSISVHSSGHDITHISIINVMGELVSQLSIPADTTQLVRTNLPPGIYVIHAMTTNSSITAKLVVE